MKVSIDGELYIVEMMFQTLTAKIQINSQTKEIKEYEFQGAEAPSKSFLQSKMMMLIVAAVPTAILVLNLIGVI